MSDLNGRQIAWLRFHSQEPEPHRWEWLTAEGHTAHGPPDTWRVLKAWKRSSGRTLTSSIRAEERESLRPYFDGFPRVNDAGRALLLRHETLRLARPL